MGIKVSFGGLNNKVITELRDSSTKIDSSVSSENSSFAPDVSDNNPPEITGELESGAEVDVRGMSASYIKGEDGATFLPSVTEDGVLSWTNDKELENPPSATIKGKDGKNAYEYAKEAGYPGTEEEFAERMAKEFEEEVGEDRVKEIVEEYLEENPQTPQITINGNKPDENGNFVVEIDISSTYNVVEF